MNNFPTFDIHAIARHAMSLYGFLPQFPLKVIEEVESLKAVDWKNDVSLNGTKDLRHLLWSSIDNVDSLDLDQLEYCERHSNRDIRVLIAVADVDEYVLRGSATDHYASYNGTSVYTGIEVFCMLPQRLSWDLSSLRQEEVRLAVVVDFFVRSDGSVRFNDIYRAIVENKAKLVYESIGEWLEEKTSVPDEVKRLEDLQEQLLLQDEAALRLAAYRRESGALELETIEASTIVREGEVVDLKVKKKNRARMIIENFMIAANGTMVWFLGKEGCPMIQRIVRTPEKWRKITEVASELGDHLPSEPDPRALADFLQYRKV